MRISTRVLPWFSAILVIWMALACVSPCTHTSLSKAGLTRHQNGCSAFRTSQELKLEQRRLTAVRTKQQKARIPPPCSKEPSHSKSNKGLEHDPSGSNVYRDPQVTFDQCAEPSDVSMHANTPLEAPMLLSPPLPPPSPPLPLPPPPPRSQVTTPAVGNVRQPCRFDDEPPDCPAPIPPPPRVIRRVILHVRDSFRSAMNRFHVLREYHHRPSYDPDAHLKPEDLANFQIKELPQSDNPSNPQSHPPPPWPFENMSKYLLMNWFHSGGHQKSEGEVNRLVKEVLAAREFSPTDLADFTIRQGNKTLDEAYVGSAGSGSPFSNDEWQEIPVDIEIPVPRKNANPKTFRVPGLQRRPIMNVIKSTWESVASRHFHLTPFKRIHIHPTTGKETRLYDEVYTSDAWIEAHDKLQKQPNELGCTLEKVIAGLMFWSDSTHLTNFGTASAWPLYMYFANLSKYVRARPNSGACHHIAFLPYVSLDMTSNLWLFTSPPSYQTASVISSWGFSPILVRESPFSATANENFCIKYGVCYLTTIFYMLINMALSFGVMMESFVEFTLAYLRTPQTTPWRVFS
jgi:hypothetical protein